MLMESARQQSSSRFHRIRRAVYKGAAILSLAAMAVGSAQAAFVQLNHDRFGTNSMVQDTSTGLHWLKLSNHGLSLINYQSYNEVMAKMLPGGELEGFRYATAAEVFQLAENHGFDFSKSGYSPENFVPVNNLLYNLGRTGDGNAGQMKYISGITADSIEDGTRLGAQFTACYSYELKTCSYDEVLGGQAMFREFEFDEDQKAYTYSHWLIWEPQNVRPVPEPGIHSMLLLGLGIAGVVVRRRKHSIQ